MAGLDALQLIQDALTQPLPNDETRRVVFCLDVDESFEEGFDRLMETVSDVNSCARSPLKFGI